MNYYGVRYAIDCHPSDLFVTYFTSSAYVAAYIKEHGDPDIIEVRKTFTTEDRVTKSLEYEHRVMKRLGVTTRNDYLNKQNNGSKFYMDKTDIEVETRRLENLRASQAKEETKQKKRASMKKFLSDPKNREKLTSRINSEVMLKKRRDFLQNDPRIRAMRKVTGDQTSRYDHAIYHFVHVSGEEKHATKYDMKIYVGGSTTKIYDVANGKRHTYKGWSLFGKSSSRAQKRAEKKYSANMNR